MFTRTSILLALSSTQRTQRDPCLEGREIRRTDSESSPAERLQAVSRRSCMTPLIHKGPSATSPSALVGSFRPGIRGKVAAATPTLVGERLPSIVQFSSRL